MHQLDAASRSIRVQRLLVPASVLAAFLARLCARLVSGATEYQEGAYQFYRDIALTWTSGHGFCVEAGLHCAMRMPFYPVLLAPFAATGTEYPWLVAFQAACGAALVWVVWDLTRHLFGRRAAMVAALLAAVSPYAVVHDTALQETVIVNLLVAAAVLVLLKARHAERAGLTSAGHWLAGGLLLGLSVMTTARVALLLPAAGVWVLFASRASLATALRNALLVALPATLLIGGWMVRNLTVVGAPVLTTESGESFWAANNEWTLQFLPDRSIDLAVTRSYESLPVETAAALDSLGDREVARDRALAELGWSYVGAHPRQVMAAGARKIWYAARGTLSPARGAVQGIGYAAFFIPLHLVAGLALLASWRRGWAHRLVPLLLAAFAFTTAIYWAHTSHKSLIDAFLFVYAAGAVTQWFKPRLSAATDATAP